MSTIKNIHKISPLLSESDLSKLEAGAAQHKRYSNIEFKVLDVDQDPDKRLYLKVNQGKHLSENYQDLKGLVKLTKDLFARFFLDYSIHVHPTPFIQPKPNVVTSEWIEKRMLETGTRIVDMEKQTGIPKASLSAWINSKKPMSNIVKAMFYYYFAG